MFDRRHFLKTTLAGLALHRAVAGQEKKPTRFQIACMTLAVLAVPARAGPDRHQGGRLPVRRLGHHAPGSRRQVGPGDRRRRSARPRRRSWARRCRDLGLEPLMMFSGIYPESPKTAWKCCRQRILQAAAAGIPQVLTFGHTKGGNRKLWVERFKELGPIAKDNNVLLVVKQHGGETGTGEACAEITREVNHAEHQGQLRRRQRDGLPRRRSDPRHQEVRRRGAQLLHQGPPQLSRRTRTAAPASARSTTTSCCTRSPSPAGRCRCAARTSSPR